MTDSVSQMVVQKLWKFGKLQDDGMCLKFTVLVLGTGKIEVFWKNCMSAGNPHKWLTVNRTTH